MVRLSGGDDPLLGRPLALYDTVLSAAGAPLGIDVVYLVRGRFTGRLAQYKAQQRLDVWGPLGNGFGPQASDHLIMVAGGIGQTPLLALARQCLGDRRYGDPPREAALSSRVTLCYGVRSADLLACVEDFQRIGVDVRLATEDGSRGRRGLVTQWLEPVLAEDSTPARIVCCGPEPMMEAVARIAAQAGAPCQVSLETHMACGIGICFTCVAKVRDASGSWDYKRTCVEGPVFDAAQIEWR
jgi:dihydroorotate dehydrogenase electron transfer subunit